MFARENNRKRIKSLRVFRFHLVRIPPIQCCLNPSSFNEKIPFIVYRNKSSLQLFPHPPCGAIYNEMLGFTLHPEENCIVCSAWWILIKQNSITEGKSCAIRYHESASKVFFFCSFSFLPLFTDRKILFLVERVTSWACTMLSKHEQCSIKYLLLQWLKCLHVSNLSTQWNSFWQKHQKT